jgi:hypothetical protein
MIKLTKFVLIVAALATVNSYGAQRVAAVAKKHWRLAFATGMGTLQAYNINKLYNGEIASVIKSSDMSTEDTAYVRGVLSKNDISPDGIRLKYLSRLQSVSGENPIIGAASEEIDMCRNTKNDFLILHEAGHIASNDSFKRRSFLMSVMPTVTFSTWHFMLKAPSIRRAIATRLPVVFLFSALYTPLKRTIDYHQELNADKFAVDCLMKKGDVAGLGIAADFWDKFAPVENAVIAGDLNMPVEEFDAMRTSSKFQYRFARGLVDEHPPAVERGERCRAAADELEREQAREYELYYQRR